MPNAISPASSQVPTELLAAYKAARFRVDTNPPIYLYVDQPCEALKVFYQTTNHQQFAFITAFNPKGELSSDDKNLSLQQALIKRVKALNLSFIEGLGEDIEGLWPGEASLYIPAISLKLAKQLGAEFEQIAIVYGDADAIPSLVVLR